MREDVAKAWIADLRSNPPQAQRQLFDGKGHCCLGRLCVVQGREFTYGTDHYYRVDGSWISLPQSVLEEVGMWSSCGECSWEYTDWQGRVYTIVIRLTDLNDGLNDDPETVLTLPQIGDVVEFFWDLL